MFLLFGFKAAHAQEAAVDSLRQLYERAQTDEERIIYLSKIGFYTIGTNPDSALQITQKAFDLAKKMSYQEGLASCYNTLGWAFFHKGQNEKAIEYIQSAIIMYEQMKNEEALFSSFFNLSSIFIRQGNYAEALKYSLKCLPLIDKYPDHAQTTGIYKNMGIIYREMADYDKAITYFNKAIDINLKNHNHHLAADIKVSLGILYNQLGKSQHALHEYEESYNLFKKEKSHYGMSIVRENEGELYLKQKKYKKALACFEEAQSGYEALGNKPDIAFISMNIAKVYAAQQDFPTAIRNLENGLAVAQETGAKNYEMDIYSQLSQTYEKTGDFALALHHYKAAQQLKDSLQSEAQVNQLNRVRTEFESEQKDQKIALLNAEQSLQREVNKRRLLFAAVGLLVVGSLAVAWFIRSKFLKKENIIAHQERQLAKRQQQETEQKLLRSQMNPHFIFNCLNTIDSFVLQNKKMEASRLIQRFSKLSRQVLEFTAQSDISVNEDMEMIRVYLQIEQTRSSGNFDFSIDIEDAVKECRLAPMIIQPFVENAVVHGIKNRVGSGGLISITAMQDHERIKFSVYDNGVGRRMAQLIKNEQKKSHNSKAMDITAARLAALHRGAVIDDYVKYTDFEGEKSGTKVEIWVPKVLPT